MLVDFFSKNNIKGVIFDCDGVLVDSEVLSCGALNVIFEKYFNVDIGTDYSPIVGKALKDSIGYFLKTFSIQVPDTINLDDLYKEKDLAYMNVARNKIKLFPGVLELLDYLIKSNLKFSLASSGTPEKINFNLEQGKISNYFKIVTSAKEVKNGKPHPDLFLLSAKKLSLLPADCAVIEDSVSGIKAAKAAHMVAIAVTNTFDHSTLQDAGADIIVTRLNELI